ncbi:MAG: ABC transporter substrate-binding protein [Candidatus Adiutrix sp.]|nr:ABC transporter substrate-binding protein [Candidatus Adiutrix sp.]
MRRLVLVLLILLLASAEAAAQPAPRRPAALRPEQIFRAIYPTAPGSLDPHGPPDPAAWPVIMACYNRLVTMTNGTAKPEPSLAQTIRVSPDGLKYTFTLYEGLTFADGTVVNADAVFFSFDRLMSSPVGRQFFPHLQRFEPVGPYSFRLILSRPWPPFLASLALPQASIVSPGLGQRHPSYLDTRTLGSGNYTVYDWKDGTIGLQQRPELPARHKVGFAMFHYEPDAQKRYEKMAAYDAHLTIAPQLPPQGMPPQYQTLSVPGFSVRFLALNTARPYTRMQTTRRAMSFIVQNAFREHSGRLDGPFPPGLFFDAPRRADPPELGATDPLTQAAVIIRDAGPPQTPLNLIIRAGDDSLARDAAAVIAALSPYGFQINLLTLDGAKLRQVMETGDYDLYLGSRAVDIPSADMWLGRFLDPAATVDGNPALFRDRQAGQLIVDINGLVGQPGDGPQELAALDRDRAIKVAALADIARTEAPYVFLYQLESSMVVDERLANSAARPHPMWPDIWPLDNLDLSPFVTRSGVNPTGRRPDPPAPAPAATRAESPATVPAPAAPQFPIPAAPTVAAPAAPAPSPATQTAPPVRLEGEDPAPAFDEFLGDVM